ncbi:MAG: hypothetical protein LWW83_00685 [Azonexaceae bacterium]|nr:hypothetical protein [Azonexaceae bacterium]
MAELVVEGNDSPGRTRRQLGQRGIEAAAVDDLDTGKKAAEKPSGGFALRRPPIFKESDEIGVYLRFR